jgi:hypothetical protein
LDLKINRNFADKNKEYNRSAKLLGEIKEFFSNE